MPNDIRNIEKALSSISDHWQPHRLTSINDYPARRSGPESLRSYPSAYDVKVVKLQGEFVWHTHPETDELFLVIAGELTIQLRDRDVVLGPNDVFVVPRGVEHCPKADAEVHAVLFEPQGTTNTGDAGGPRTATLQELSPHD